MKTPRENDQLASERFSEEALTRNGHEVKTELEGGFSVGAGSHSQKNVSVKVSNGEGHTEVKVFAKKEARDFLRRAWPGSATERTTFRWWEVPQTRGTYRGGLAMSGTRKKGTFISESRWERPRKS